MKRGEGDASAASRKERKEKRPAAVAWERGMNERGERYLREGVRVKYMG
jgi:hypothetical protein